MSGPEPCLAYVNYLTRTVRMNAPNIIDLPDPPTLSEMRSIFDALLFVGVVCDACEQPNPDPLGTPCLDCGNPRCACFGPRCCRCGLTHALRNS